MVIKNLGIEGEKLVSSKMPSNQGRSVTSVAKGHTKKIVSKRIKIHSVGHLKTAIDPLETCTTAIVIEI